MVSGIYIKRLWNLIGRKGKMNIIYFDEDMPGDDAIGMLFKIEQGKNYYIRKHMVWPIWWWFISDEPITDEQINQIMKEEDLDE